MEDITKKVSKINLYDVIYEVNLIYSNLRELWFDSGATCYICYDMDSFAKLDP